MKNTTIIIFFSFIVTLVQSCKLNDNKKLIISGSKAKLWEVIAGGPNNSKATYYYYFTNKGGFKIYEQFYYSDQIKAYSGLDVYYQRTGELKNDTVIDISGVNYRILKLSIDTLKLYDKDSKKIETLHLSSKFVE